MKVVLRAYTDTTYERNRLVPDRPVLVNNNLSRNAQQLPEIFLARVGANCLMLGERHRWTTLQLQTHHIHI